MRNWKRQTLFGALAIAVCIGSWAFRVHAQTAPPSQKNRRPTAPKQLKPQGKVFMSAKLTSSQEVLKGLLTRDFEKVRRGAEVLRDVALTAPPREVREEFDSEVYEHFRNEFLRHSGQLELLAGEQNLEGAAYVHQNLTATCIACHEYLRDRTLPSRVVPATYQSATRK